MLKQLTVEKLSKKIGLRTILKDITLTVKAGELVVITGPNGAGKTTLLRILAGMTPQTSGQIHWEDRVFSAKETDLLRQVGLLGHKSMVYDSLTAFENLKFFSKLYGLKGSKIRIGEMLRWVGLYSCKHERVENFSRGMQQRLALARMLIHAPVLLLYDEPFTGLDAEGQRLLTSTLKAMQAEGRMQILITHNLDELQGLNYREVRLIAGTLIATDVPLAKRDDHLTATDTQTAVDELAAGQEIAEAKQKFVTAKRVGEPAHGLPTGKLDCAEVQKESAGQGASEKRDASGSMDAQTISEAWKLAREKAERLSAQAPVQTDEKDHSFKEWGSSLSLRMKAIFAQIKEKTGLLLHKEEKLPQGGITVEEFLRKQDSEEVGGSKTSDIDSARPDQKGAQLAKDINNMPKLHENVFLAHRYKGNPVQKKGSSQVQNRGGRVRRNTLRERNHPDEKRDKS